MSPKKLFHCNAAVVVGGFLLAVYDYKTIRVKSRRVRDSVLVLVLKPHGHYGFSKIEKLKTTLYNRV